MSDVIYDRANTLLSEIATRLPTYGRVAPSKQFVHVGQVAYDADEDADCDELLAVEIVRGFRGIPGNEGIGDLERCTAPRSMEYRVHLIRCITAIDSSGAPGTAEMDEDALELSRDADAMLRAVSAAASAEAFGSCNEVMIDALEVYGPLGGVAGWRLLVHLPI